MSVQHKTSVNIDENSKVDHIWFDNEDEGTLNIGFRSVTGKYENRVFVSTEIWLSAQQAKELLNALSTALVVFATAPNDTSDYLEREQLGLGVSA